jgi:hypothetical protein
VPIALVGISPGAIVGLANHGGITICSGVLLRWVHALVHDVVRALGTFGETTLSGSDGTASAVAAAWGSGLVLAACRLGLECSQYGAVEYREWTGLTSRYLER